MKKITTYIKDHKLIVFILGIVIIGGGYFWYQRSQSTASVTRYVLGTAEKGSVIVSVSGSGQVSAISQIDIKPDTSGKLVKLNVKDNQTVKAGDVIGIIDQKDSLLSLTQARSALASAQSNYDKVVAGITPDDKKLAQNSVDSAASAYQSALVDLANTEKTTAQTVAQAEKDLADLQDLSSTNANNKRDQVVLDIESKIKTAKDALDDMDTILTNDNATNNLSAQNLTYLQLASGYYNQALPLLETANSSLNIAKGNKSDTNINQAVIDTLNLLDKTGSALNNFSLVMDNSVTSARYTQSNLDSDKSTINSDISAISSAVSALKTSWQNLKDAITTAQNDMDDAKLTATQQVATAQAKVDSTAKSLENAKINYNKTVAPPTEDEIRSAQSTLTNAQISVTTAQNNYQKTIIKSPIDGIITNTQINIGDDISPATVIATVFTPNKMAEVSLNEVDTAKVKIGQKANLTFNAIDGLNITGTVSDIDMIGTVAQGVVSYNVKIVFDVQDDRVKPSMTVSADIITNQSLNVITVPNAAVKTDASGGNYVQELTNLSTDQTNSNQPITSATAPVNVTVTVGLADDTNTEVLSGLNEGEKIITSTITGNSSGTSSGQPTNNRGGGGAIFQSFGG